MTAESLLDSYRYADRAYFGYYGNDVHEVKRRLLLHELRLKYLIQNPYLSDDLVFDSPDLG
jgi:hypothetical protein